ncbi:hypothetical protein [Stenotrophomonas sp. 3(2025)]
MDDLLLGCLRICRREKRRMRLVMATIWAEMMRFRRGFGWNPKVGHVV